MVTLDWIGIYIVSTMVTIVGLTISVLVSRRARQYAHVHPVRFAALAVLLTVANAMANKQPPDPPDPPPAVKEAAQLRLIDVQDPRLDVYRPLDFKIITK